MKNKGYQAEIKNEMVLYEVIGRELTTKGERLACFDNLYALNKGGSKQDTRAAQSMAGVKNQIQLSFYEMPYK